MKVTFDDSDLEYLRNEIIRLRSENDSNESIVEAHEKCLGMVIGWQAAAEYVAHSSIMALKNRTPFSVIRLGDGEGNILGCCDPDLDSFRELKWFNSIFHYQTGAILNLTEAVDFSEKMQTAFLDANILGTRILAPWKATDWSLGPSLQWAQDMLEKKKKIRGALGVLRADDQVKKWLNQGLLNDSVLTHAWFYSPILSHLDKIIDESRNVIIISCRKQIFEPMVRKFPTKTITFKPVPIEPPLNSNASGSHYPEVYDEILDYLDQDLSGSLVLVGAGVFGKIYCHAAKSAGAVSLDIGSAFDILAGIQSRPVHQTEDVKRFRMVEKPTFKFKSKWF